jgi:formamidopyrimidine-DNA glycosylase
MPELPEVETAARDLDAQVAGARIAELEKLDTPKMVETPELEVFKGLIVGHRIARAYRRAKWILVTLDAGWTLAIHLRMSGSIWVAGPDEAPDAHVHLILRLEDGRRIFFRDVRKFGRLRLLDAEGLAALDRAHGPEPLEAGFTEAVLKRLVADRATKLKPLLLDQSVIAGLGNIYVDESLWYSQLHPTRPASSLKPKEVHALYEAIRFVLEKAVKARGSTLRDYRTGYGAKGEMQDEFQAYDREGEPCPRCATPIRRIVIAQRGTHLCPACQRS